MLTSEQSCLLALARTTWAKRGAAKQAGLPYNEETVTETMLLDLKVTYPGRVIIVPFTKAEEALCGADWAWAFVSADRRWSFTMLVQAKRLDDLDRDYKGIKRHIGSAVPPVRQIDRLIATAASWGIPPVYAFYNHVRDRTRVPAQCGSIPSGTNEQIEAWGISLANALAVEPLLPDEAFDTHSRHSIPLHCMLCTRGSGYAGPTGSPGPVGDALSRIGPDGGDREPGPDSGRYLPREGLHPIVKSAYRVSQVEDAADRDMSAKQLAEEFPGIAGVVILEDAEETPAKERIHRSSFPQRSASGADEEEVAGSA